jgi:hypothetical protein
MPGRDVPSKALGVVRQRGSLRCLRSQWTRAFSSQGRRSKYERVISTTFGARKRRATR